MKAKPRDAELPKYLSHLESLFSDEDKAHLKIMFPRQKFCIENLEVLLCMYARLQPNQMKKMEWAELRPFVKTAAEKMQEKARATPPLQPARKPTRRISAAAQVRYALRKRRHLLSKEEVRVVRMAFGLNAHAPRSFPAIASRLDITKPQAQSIFDHAVSALLRQR